MGEMGRSAGAADHLAVKLAAALRYKIRYKNCPTHNCHLCEPAMESLQTLNQIATIKNQVSISRSANFFGVGATYSVVLIPYPLS